MGAMTEVCVDEETLKAKKKKKKKKKKGEREREGGGGKGEKRSVIAYFRPITDAFQHELRNAQHVEKYLAFAC